MQTIDKSLATAYAQYVKTIRCKSLQGMVYWKGEIDRLTDLKKQSNVVKIQQSEQNQGVTEPKKDQKNLKKPLTSTAF